MSIDLENIDRRQFELLALALLRAEGYSGFADFTDVQHGDSGYDFLCLDRNQVVTVVEAKRISSPPFASVLRRAVEDLRRAVALKQTTQALLILSAPLPPFARERLIEGMPMITVWDGDHVNSLLTKHSDVRAKFETLERAQESISTFVDAGDETSAPKANIASELIRRLEALPRGPKHWRDYEKLCEEILVYAFVPPLRVPRRQSGTNDKLDRRDLVFPLGTSHMFWDRVRIDFGSRVVVAEFKNNTKPIGQKEVESLQQYLFAGAMRSFGLLCCRAAPSSQAERARRRAWVLSKAMIIFLSDDDMKEIVRRRSTEVDVTEPIDLQLDEFFVSLAP